MEDNRLKEFRWIIKNEFNSRNQYIISSAVLAESLRKNSAFSEEKNIPQYITNTFQYLIKRKEAFKLTNAKGKYFVLIKHSYPLMAETEVNLSKLKKEIEISESTVNTFKDLSNISFSNKEEFEFYKAESVFSTIIENGTLTSENLESRMQDEEDPEIIEFENIWNLYKKISIEEYKEPLSDSVLKYFHKQLFKHLLDTKRVNLGGRVGYSAGDFIKDQNFISGGYLPCPLEYKLGELKDFIEFYNKKPKNITEALINVAYISYWFAGIHIFPDGNSRTGRFLVSYYMYIHGMTKKPNFLISKSLNNIGAKAEFISQQGKSWDNKNVKYYIEWFIEELIDISWALQTKKMIKQNK